MMPEETGMPNKKTKTAPRNPLPRRPPSERAKDFEERPVWMGHELVPFVIAFRVMAVFFISFMSHSLLASVHCRLDRPFRQDACHLPPVHTGHLEVINRFGLFVCLLSHTFQIGFA
jgi:hypothetical protein